jgi:hypothetical protein
MIELPWLVAGLILGLLVSAVSVPPARKVKSLPQPNDSSIYHTDDGCVRFNAIEVPCTQEPTSLNLLASVSKKQWFT